MVKALIFDFDGLIVDTESTDLAAWQQIFAAHGCDFPTAEWAAHVGSPEDRFDPCAHFEAQTGRPVDCERLWAEQNALWVKLTEAQPVLPGVREIILKAKRLGLKLAIASSGARERVERQLAQVGLLYAFDCIRCREDVAHAKPAPDLFLAVLEALAISPFEAIVLEDSMNGVLAAKRAGIFCVAVPNPATRHMAFDEADLVLTSVGDFHFEHAHRNPSA